LRQLLAPLRKREGELEKQIANRQQRLVEIEQQLADSALYEAPHKAQLQKILEEQGALRKQIDDLEMEWFAVQEQLENVSEE
jgi:ATP-binding cassette subfamily F protein 3